MSEKVQQITEPLQLGEGPHWDDRQQALFFVDIFGRTIHKYVPATGVHTKTKLDGRVGFIVPVEGSTDQFVVGLELKFVVVQWDGSEGGAVRVLRELAEVERGLPHRINDAKCDPKGRLFGGTMAPEETPGVVINKHGNLYRIDRGEIKTLASGIGISNGLAWDVAAGAFYYTDSCDGDVRRYDYDLHTGHISNQKFIFNFKENGVKGVPDGTTIDTDGNLWIASFGGRCVVNVDPRTGKLIRKIDIPANQVTSVTWGGRDLDVLFVTSASLSLPDEQPAPCGATFMVTGLGAKGLPNVSYKL